MSTQGIPGFPSSFGIILFVPPMVAYAFFILCSHVDLRLHGSASLQSGRARSRVGLLYDLCPGEEGEESDQDGRHDASGGVGHPKQMPE